MKYKVYLKAPFNGRAILPHLGANISKSPETDKLKTKRENVANMLEFLTKKEVTWVPRMYLYLVELTEEQVVIVSSWAYVRRVVKE